MIPKEYISLSVLRSLRLIKSAAQSSWAYRSSCRISKPSLRTQNNNYLSVLKIWNTTLTYHHCTMEIWKVAPKSRDPVISQAVWSVWQFSRCSIMQAAISITTTANRRSEDQSIAQRWRRDHSDFHREWITVSADRSHFLTRKIIFFVLILMTSRN